MTVQDGYVGVAADGAGKKVDNTALTLPSGTVVLNADGSTSTLASDTVVYRQRIVLGDSTLLGEAGVAEVRNHKLQTEDRGLQVMEAILARLESIEIHFKFLTAT